MYTLHLGDPGEGSKELWSLREDVFVEPYAPDGSVTLYGRWGDVVLQQLPETVTKFLHRMQLGPVSLTNVLGEPSGSGPLSTADRATLFVTLERLRHLIVRSLSAGHGEQPLVSVIPMSPRAAFQVKPLDPDLPVRLSVFATLGSDGTALSLESPLSLHHVLLHAPQAAWLVATLARPRTAAEAAALATMPQELASNTLAYLVAAGMVVQSEPDSAPGSPRFAEDHDPSLRGWTRTDLAFHVSSTLGRHDRDFGATYPLGGEARLTLLPELPRHGPRIPLSRPRLTELLDRDPPFTAVLEGRRSVRRFGKSPLTAAQLGELLYRSLRIRSLIGAEGSAPEQATTMDRPYPAGGAIHELGFFVVVDRCEGVARGVYAYDAAEHALAPVDAEAADTDLLLAQARTAANMAGAPPVLIVITARFERLFWKYAGLGYALALKHVGVAQQTLYLVAAAMGLAACAIGTGEIEDSARILGLDWLTESCVGGFTVGRTARRAAADRGARHPVNDADWAELCRARLPPAR
ncbi:SagB family peptide dehydrogenase [Actinocrinis sp.]|uniref:SagB family peptide dehydrogenase n=1 Tax=Actinocrinis sp. TaxID=1920516 RepID=UPI002D2C614E|nr:SagB family peptide dehydrogenase [Actinocrinis sp.]HZP50540.1 SagB family peptide dehydrogenase [Actinocrinis sp.]